MVVTSTFEPFVLSSEYLDANFYSATNTSIPTSAPSPTNVPEPGAAFQNAVSGGLLGAVVAAGLALVGSLESIFGVDD